MILSTRTAICDALAHAYTGNTATGDFQTFGCRIDRSTGNAAYLMAIAVQYAKIRAAISECAPHIRDWLYYAYGPDVESLRKDSRHAALASTVTQEAFHGPMSHRKVGKLSKIAYIAVLDYRVGQTMGKSLPVSEYTNAIGYTSSQWARDWEPYRRAALNVIGSYDKDGVARVSITVRAIRKANSE